MAADFASFKLKYPELVSEGDGNQTAIDDCIATAKLIFGTPPCPKLADNLILAWAANCLAKSGNNPNGADTAEGAASSKSVGSVSVSYQLADTNGTLGQWYASTPYGQQFLMFQKYCFGAGVMVAP